MNNGDPIAFFVTWTVYGTHLQGDGGGWRRRGAGHQNPQPLLAKWHADRLKHAILLLSASMRSVVDSHCQQHCDHRGWQLWAVNVRTSHVHVVVTAPGTSGRAVRDQLKANCTRGLREQWSILGDRPVWTVAGDWQCINSDNDLDAVIRYVRDAQDLKYLGEPAPT